MKSTDIPAKFPIPWANSASTGYIRSIPVTSQIGIEDGAASLEDGWVPDNFVEEALGGVPSNGKDDNGIKNQITANIRWVSAGMTAKYDATFSAYIGGYPKGSILQKTDLSGFWRSTVDDNTTNPDASGAGWTSTTITAANDPTYANDSTTNVSSSWVRRAMGVIMASLGFAFLKESPGYIKLPSCLGGFIVQWGEYNIPSATTVYVNFPLTFPNECWAVIPGIGYNILDAQGTVTAGAQKNSTSQFKLSLSSLSDSGSYGVWWIAVGY